MAPLRIRCALLNCGSEECHKNNCTFRDCVVYSKQFISKPSSDALLVYTVTVPSLTVQHLSCYFWLSTQTDDALLKPLSTS
jgi:hypothetical protein